MKCRSRYKIGSVASKLDPFFVSHDTFMTRRYYVPELPSSGGLVELPKPEAQHAIRVMRVLVGDAVILFDGLGREAAAVIESVGRNECVCAVENVRSIDRELGRSLHLAIALPKPDRAREMIERLTEIGVTKVTPLVAQHTQRSPTESLVEKLRRGVIEACKQCGRNQLLEIAANGFNIRVFSCQPWRRPLDRPSIRECD